ncbi:MAG TPA: hypothetical protein VHR18_10510 [Solirubrobacterales bacterium]|jgi:hypothetical protein|nr:hypothetical protein [Solirubrobacterales bacterium]
MTNLRLRRHLSYANVMASFAVFLALGGVGYAATTINGNQIKKGTVGAGKLKSGTLTSKQVKADALGGSVIDESTLSIVPSAQTANSATTAVSATTATTANHATTATTASSAEDAETLEGFSADELELSCPAATDLYGGMCWDENVRPAKHWLAAAVECGDAGGRLPSLGELVAYILRPGEQVTAQTWSADVVDLVGGKEVVLTSDETSRSTSESSVTQHGYRCLFYRTN